MIGLITGFKSLPFGRTGWPIQCNCSGIACSSRLAGIFPHFGPDHVPERRPLVRFRIDGKDRKRRLLMFN